MRQRFRAVRTLAALVVDGDTESERDGEESAELARYWFESDGMNRPARPPMDSRVRLGEELPLARALRRFCDGT